MGKTFLIFLTILFFCSCKKEQDDLQNIFPTHFLYEGEIGSSNNSTLISKDNNLVICGNGNTGGICIVKISKSGDLIWKNEFSKGYECGSNSIAESDNEELFVCGNLRREITISGRSDVWIVKISKNGDTLWTKTYGSPEADFGHQIIKTSDNYLLISGRSGIKNSGNDCLYLLKIDFNGDTLWTKTYLEIESVFPNHLLETENGDFFLTGTYDNSESERELYFLKIDKNGNILWDKRNGSAGRWGYCTIELTDGDLLTCGSYLSDGSTQVMLIESDNIGNTIWEKKYGDENLSEHGSSMKFNFDGTITITGSSNDPVIGDSDIILLKVDQNGNQIWLKKYGNPEVDESASNLLKDSNDDNIITGTTLYYRFVDNSNETETFIRNIYMTRLDNDGNFK